MRPFSLDFLGDVLFWYIKRDKIFLYTNRSVLVMKNGNLLIQAVGRDLSNNKKGTIYVSGRLGKLIRHLRSVL